MPATAAALGISDASAATLCQSLDVEKKVEVKEIIAKDGTFGAAGAQDPMLTFSVKVKDSVGVDVGAGAAGLAAISGGKTLILSVKDTQKGDDYPEGEYSGENYPAAS